MWSMPEVKESENFFGIAFYKATVWESIAIVDFLLFRSNECGMIALTRGGRKQWRPYELQPSLEVRVRPIYSFFEGLPKDGSGDRSVLCSIPGHDCLICISNEPW